MTKDEALDLALESFAPHNGVFWRNLHKNDAEIANAITAIKQALEAPQEPEHIVHSNGRYSPLLTRMMNKRVESNVKQVIHLYDDPPAQPTERTGEAPCARHCEATAFQIVIKNLRGEIDRLKAAQPAPVQEPVAVARVDDLERGGRVRALAMGLALDAVLYTTPPAQPCPTCEALARTVMMDQTGRDA